MSRLSDSICICKSCQVCETCTYYNKAIKPIFDAAEFCAFDFDDNDPLTYKLISILKTYTCYCYCKKEADSPGNLE